MYKVLDMRTGNYVMQRIKALGCPVTVFVVNGRLRVMQANDSRVNTLLADPELASMCLGTFDESADERLIDAEMGGNANMAKSAKERSGWTLHTFD